MTALIAGIAAGTFFYFMFWGWLGQVAMMLVQFKKYFQRIKSEAGVSPAYWLKDNVLRIIISFVIAALLSPIAVLVALKVPEGLSGLMEWTCIGTGALIDKTVESFTNKKK